MGSANRVLVVDDEPAIRALISKIVQRAGLAVDAACDGAQAMEMLRANAYNVLVIDLMMPNVNGYDLIDFVRDSTRPRPAIIVITAGDTSLIRRLDPTMVHSVLRKPFDIDVLGDLISAAAQSMEDGQRAISDSNVLDFRKNVC